MSYDIAILGEIAELKGGKRLPKGKMLTSKNTGHPYIRITDISNHKIITSNLLYVDAEDQKKISRYIVKAEDLILTIVGTIGLVAIVPKTLENANLTENCIKINLNKEKLFTKFAYYFLTSKEGQDQIHALNVGSTQPKLPLYNIAKIEIPAPPLPEQQAIAEVLSSLDDKIDLLHRNNKTLEEMAETLFRQWFVEGLPTNMPETSIYDYIRLDYGFPFSSKKFNENSEGTQLIRIRDISKGFSNTYTTEIANDIYIIHPGDLLVGMDGEFRIHIWGGKKAWLNQRVCRVSPLEGTPPLWAYFMMKPHLNFYEQTKGGTTVIHIGKSDFDEIRIPRPQRETLDKYNNITQPLFSKILSNYNAISCCTELRDTLLPKLMSGQVRVQA